MHALPGHVTDGLGKPRHGVIHRDAERYSAHPHLAVTANGTWLLVFTQAPQRHVVLHPPLDPEFRNMMMRSHDQGRSWTAPLAVPDEECIGMECAGLTPLADGAILLNQWQFGWVDPETDAAEHQHFAAPEVLALLHARSPEFAGLHPDTPVDLATLFPQARSGGACRVHRAANPCAPFEQSIEVNTRPYAGGYGMRGGLELPDGDILLPLSDVPYYRTVFVVRSSDGGQTWSRPVTVASHEACAFEEPAPVLLPNGRILMMLRENTSRVLHSVWSADGGHTWSAPQATGIHDYPADLAVLRDGRIVMVAGRRNPPFGIALYLSDSHGESWRAPIMIRDDLPDRDLGYPSLVERRDGELYVAYYGRTDGDTTAILSTTVPRHILDDREENHGTG
ncbi:MAG: exo-alpha-sialidase [Hyphomicrobiales bacterium]|nr:exo-alpha-sialidase [Hyphomicrobiales bacterium]